ncbi:MAG: 4-hydroxy-tetrahydrodipicolinate reductase [Phycisphaerae bacterium]|nr:4-hydroxy-tetrahydrodipicolinate reductase [Phycisphaerae bacterium]
MTTSAVSIVINGSQGRMGARIAACATDDPSVMIAALFDRGDVAPLLRQPLMPPSLANVGAIIDFSSDEGARDAVALARRLSSGLLVGTTALSKESIAAIDSAAREIPVMVCSNTSLGVAVARRLAAEAARLLGAVYDVDIIETHHTKKLDAPSGTALALAASVREGGGSIAADRVHAIRAGDVIGDHVVQFAGIGEVLRIQHTATTRDLFARGAIRAAKWLCGKPSGRYRIEDTFPT